MSETESAGDWDIKGRDIRQLFAGFARLPLTDSQVWSLSMAQAIMPPEHIGFKAWITCIADVDCYGDELARWAKSLARTMASLKPLRGARRDKLVRVYHREWGDQAALDGLQAALWGDERLPTCSARAETFGCRWQAYKRIRDIVRGVVTMQMQQYESAVAWAVRVQRRA